VKERKEGKFIFVPTSIVLKVKYLAKHIRISDHDAGFDEGLVDLADGVDEAGIAVREVLIDGHLPVLTDGGGHDFLKSRVDDVELVGTLELVNLA